MLTFTSQSALLATIVGITTAIAVILRGQRPLGIRYATFALSASFFYFISLLRCFIPQFDFNPLQMVAAALSLGTGAAFFKVFLSDHGVRAVRRGHIAWLTAIALVVIAIPPLVHILVLRVLASLLALGLLASLVLTMERRARDVDSEAERWRLRYVAVGGAFVIAAIVVDLLVGVGLPLPPIGGIATAIYLYFLSQILVRQRLLDLHELLAKAAVFSALALTLASTYGLLVLWAGEPGLFIFNTVLASAVILILYEPTRSWLEDIVEHALFRRNLDFAQTLSRLAKSLLSLVDPEEVQRSILDAIYNSKRVTHCAFYFVDDNGTGLQLASFRGPRPCKQLDAPLESALLRVMQKDRSPLHRDALLTDSNDSSVVKNTADSPLHIDDIQLVLDAFDAMTSDLCIPIVANDQVRGLLCLRDERGSSAFANDELTGLLRITDLVAVALENSRVIERLRERDRLAVLGEMAAGLASEINKPLSAMQTSLQALQSASSTSETRDLSLKLDNQLELLQQVVSQFLTYARPVGGHFAPINLNELVQTSLQNGQIAKMLHGVEMSLELDNKLAPISGDSVQIQQLLENILRNAVQAQQGQGKISIVTEQSGGSSQRASAQIMLRIRDNGPGVAAEVRGRLFTPFFSTREGATGLGLAISKHIADAHGGRVSFRNIAGAGAEFSVSFRPSQDQQKDLNSQPESSTRRANPVPIEQKDQTESDTQV